jgi:hypothetical protein
MNQWLNQFTVLAFSMVLVLPVTAGERCPKSKFPASGQMTAYQADINDGISDNFVEVPDDGTVQAGATLRYKDNKDGTITDRNTELVWEKKSDDGDILHDKDNTYTWSGGSGDTIWDWLEDINAEGGTGFAGHNDWRIPNVRELLSIVHYEELGPAVSSEFNTNCVPGATVITGSCTVSSAPPEPPRLVYWSSTTFLPFPGGPPGRTAWVVNFFFGTAEVGFDKTESLGRYVRAVRGGCL